MTDIKLVPLAPDDREQFVTDNQEAFNYGALEEFGRCDDHFEEDGEIISRETIEKAIDGGEAYRIMQGDKNVGGVVLKIDGDKGDLDLLFVSPKAHSKGIGYAAWCAVEKLHPEVKVWETCTPYFETRSLQQDGGFSSRGQKPHWGFFLFLLSSELHSKNRSSFLIRLCPPKKDLPKQVFFWWAEVDSNHRSR